MGDTSFAATQIVDVYIETVETGEKFIVVSGWLILTGSVDNLRMSIGSGRYMADLIGVFPRPDIAVDEGQQAYGFCVDIHFPGKVHNKVSFTIASEEQLFEFPAQDINIIEFKAKGGFDPGTAGYIAGWIYDPALWYQSPQILPTVKVGDLTIFVKMDCRRHDLPFSAAKTGKELGFQLPMTTYAGEILKLGAPSEPHKIHWLLTAAGRIVAEKETIVAEADVEQFNFFSKTLNESPPADTRDVASGLSEDTGFEQPFSPELEKGFLDYWGYSPSLQGWLVGGWAAKGAFTSSGKCIAQAIFGTEFAYLNAHFVTYPRTDVEEFGVGFVMFMQGNRPKTILKSIVIVEGENRFALRPSDMARLVDEIAVLHEARACAKIATGGSKERFREIVERPVFDGSDTISPFGPAVQLSIDEVIFAPGTGVVLMGWLLDPSSQVKEIRVRNADQAAILTDKWVSSERPDIKQAFGSALGLTHARWGFTAFGAAPAEKYSGYYLEITLDDGRIGHRAMPNPARHGIAAINRILHELVLTPDNILMVCKDVIAAPVRSINRARIKEEVTFLEASAGASPASPRTSIVIPLYGRLDFLSYQMALFDRMEHAADEFIYVLDQPERKEEFFTLARLAHIKTGIPFRMVIPSQNLGFAGASNLGLKVARGRYVCFLNSDVVPSDLDWMTRLVESLERAPNVGIMSALMLFEDETVQHAGMDFERQQQYGNMLFPFHPGKGRFNVTSKGVEIVPAVTGACMVMDRMLCNLVGGFDEDYIVGDFEDADLCMKVRDKGLACAVENGVVLYHLERQSQTKAANRGRMNLTLLNAWTFAERWDPELFAADSSRRVLKIA